MDDPNDDEDVQRYDVISFYFLSNNFQFLFFSIFMVKCNESNNMELGYWAEQKTVSFYCSQWLLVGTKSTSEVEDEIKQESKSKHNKQ